MASRIAIFLIDLYRKGLSPLLPPACRFYPSCSEYAREAFEIHGFFRGAALAAWRICRCHPFHPGGFDPVPSRRAAHGSRSQEI